MIAPAPLEYQPVSTFSINGHAPAERFDAWQELIGPAYTLDASREGFNGVLQVAAVDRMLVQRMDAAAQSVARSIQQVRRDGLEHIVLHLNWHGYRFTSAAGDGEAAPGAITINDLSRPFQRSVGLDYGSIIISLSRALVESALPNCDGLHGHVLSGTSGALLVEHMRMLDGRMAMLPKASARALSEATSLMLAASLAPNPDTLAQARPALDAARLSRAKRYIRGHMSDPQLGPDRIARALGMSRSTLFSLFEPEGGVARYLRNRRLAAVADALRNPDETLPVALLASAQGFTSPSAFARAFRERYGISASEMRGGDAAVASAGSEEGQSAFANWLRAIG